MSYKEINLRAKTPETAVTEVMYEIASLRADGIGLLRINIIYEAGEELDTETKRIISQIIKLLKNMKQKGSIQFFATEDSFRLSSTEVVFLQNKYPAIFSAHPSREGESFVFVKL